ncbi:protein of unknown function [Brevefilum fermentans]|uniref:Uncharacterized protein n=1 Tax=Candidatus Brevifilum fermentans TaxID=1986204 RepID=A0A1Y6K3V1_9CHLR|nr:protein of unknown function [Brevefilum fermentans]
MVIPLAPLSPFRFATGVPLRFRDDDAVSLKYRESQAAYKERLKLLRSSQ